MSGWARSGWMSDWRTVGVRMKEEDVAQLNQCLKQLGYSSLNELVGGTKLWARSKGAMIAYANWH